MGIKIEKDIPIPKTKWENVKENRKNHIKMIAKLKVGESIVVKDRTRETVRIWAWWAIRSMGLWQKDLKEMYLVKSIDKKTQRVWKLK
tara:strand:- start:348 stop:611 length:264 start_codon:yes stop_codon:yes gene_type:complete